LLLPGFPTAVVNTASFLGVRRWHICTAGSSSRSFWHDTRAMSI
jgi:hypothetical protein